MTDSEDAVDTTVDPAKHSKGVDADLDQTDAERDEAIDEFDGHLDGSGEKPSLPTPEPTHVADKSGEKTVTRSE
ncbi:MULTISPECIES: autophagy-related protein 2 [Nocardiaceae]|uniref:Autophagy-related protein 2 n=1 Tax=Rhodococcoides yunnanense TaxID=278209 RepID=A0ABU4B7M2_9NOCA|nr:MULTISPECIES: autophagy-related protein 2 [Rhodococcus]MDI9894076.1 autophagy-related protein 2 [Rhodococcus sp. IEGM 1381]MDV6260196.1 autophagy-related protein 2 [Rhodococcus yunnanensis]